MDKRKVFDVFKFREVTKKKIQTHVALKQKPFRFRTDPLINPFHLYLAQILQSLDTDLGDMDSGPIRPMLMVSKYKNTLLLMNTYYSLIIKLNLGLSKNQI